MGFNNIYRPLFSISILHHYFLDDGTKVYGDDLSADKAAANFGKYKLSDFMQILPTTRTQRLLKNMRSRFLQTSSGFQVLTAVDPFDSDLPFIEFTPSMYLDFTCEITDPFFENYTDIRINRDKVIFLTNKTPLASELETATTVRFSKLSEFDSTTINELPVPPVSDIDIDLSEFMDSEKRGKLALIRIHMEGEVGELILTNGDDKFNPILPEVSLVFPNRATIWKYHRSSDGVVLFSSGTAKPLTKNGYVTINDGTKDLPNPSVRLIYSGEDEKYVDTEGTPISEDPTSTYSRIFI